MGQRLARVRERKPCRAASIAAGSPRCARGCGSRGRRVRTRRRAPRAHQSARRRARGTRRALHPAARRCTAPGSGIATGRPACRTTPSRARREHAHEATAADQAVRPGGGGTDAPARDERVGEGGGPHARRARGSAPSRRRPSPQRGGAALSPRGVGGHHRRAARRAARQEQEASTARRRRQGAQRSARGPEGGARAAARAGAAGHAGGGALPGALCTRATPAPRSGSRRRRAARRAGGARPRPLHRAGWRQRQVAHAECAQRAASRVQSGLRRRALRAQGV
mmetsp:Transcript_51612/g.102736  ORF Transcript_51612/g.102736 Transcript_51612/m.102736 type:complete len:282 (+) Transcript_51612:841-1686(+)